jgi:hypothetical protein
MRPIILSRRSVRCRSRILRREELPEELLKHVAGLIEFYEADDSGS